MKIKEKEENRKNVLCSERVLFLLLVSFFLAILISSQVTSQFEWQKENKTIDFSTETSQALVLRLNSFVSEYKDSYPTFFYEFSRRGEAIHKVSALVEDFMDVFSSSLIPFLMTSPNVAHARSRTFLSFSISLLEPLYIIAILLTAAHLLFFSGSPRGRAIAKKTFIKLILGLGIIMLTLPLLQMFIETAHALSSIALFLLNPNPEIFRLPVTFYMSYFTITSFFRPVVGSPFLLLSLILPAGALIVVSMRYFMLIFIAAIFPFTVLFYSFSPTKKIGREMIRFSLLWIFLQVLISFFIGITSASVSSFDGLSLKIFIATAGFLLIIASPLIFIALLDFFMNLSLVRMVGYKAKRHIDDFLG